MRVTVSQAFNNSTTQANNNLGPRDPEENRQNKPRRCHGCSARDEERNVMTNSTRKVQTSPKNMNAIQI